MSCDECEKFEIIGENATVSLVKPEHGAEGYTLSKSIDRFDLWDDDYEIVDKGIEDDSIVLSGIDTVCPEESGLCFPLCFPFCFKDILISKYISISNMMIEHEEVEIFGLGDNIDGIYIISNFRYKSMNSGVAYEWQLSLDWVRDS